MSQRLRIEDLADIYGEDSDNENENQDGEENLDDQDDDNDSEENEDEDDREPEVVVAELTTKLAETETERDQYKRRMRRADQSKARAEKERDALKQGGSKELADALAENVTLKEKLDALSGADPTAIIREEFRDYEDAKWYNPKVAFGLLDLSEVDVEDGKVDPASLADAIKKLAKDHPYLVKKAEKSKDEDEDDEEDKAPRSPSGARSLGSRKTQKTARAATIKKKYNIAGRIPI